MTDLFSGEQVTAVDELNSFRVELWPHRTTAFAVELPALDDIDPDAG